MIGFLEGNVQHLDDCALILNVQGVGYSVFATQRLLQKLEIGNALLLWVQTIVKENSLELYGFENTWEKKVFNGLLSVSGVGAKTALSLLNQREAQDIVSAVALENRGLLSGVPGVGKKTIERLFLEFREKAHKLFQEQHHGLSRAHPIAHTNRSLHQECYQALQGLGYRETEIAKALDTVLQEHSGTELSSEYVIRAALKLLHKNKNSLQAGA